jgi:signal transduction histidine kinase
MWEKIVLNLVSNAFKFTFEGEVTVRLRQQNGSACWKSRIPASAFRSTRSRGCSTAFHRVVGARAHP